MKGIVLKDNSEKSKATDPIVPENLKISV